MVVPELADITFEANAELNPPRLRGKSNLEGEGIVHGVGGGGTAPNLRFNGERERESETQKLD